jgi:hypothetical protein
MKGTGNHHIRLIGGKFFVVIRQGDRDMKVAAGAAIAEARQTRDDLMRELGLLKLTRQERRAQLALLEAEPAPARLPRRPFEYFATGCVNLLAAVYMTREAYEWATESLHAARLVDARRVA